MLFISTRPFDTGDPSQAPAWFHESPYLPYGWETSNERGAGSLKHAAMRATLQDQSLLKPDMFDHVPWLLAKYLWDSLGRCNKRTSHMWRILATKYPQHFYRVSSGCRLHIHRPLQRVADYTDLIKSNAYCWRAILSIETKYASQTSDLLNLASIKNLVALEINNERGSLYDEDGNRRFLPEITVGLVRGWIELAQPSGAWQHLRFLRIRCHQELLLAVLRPLLEFPQLQTVVIYDCENISREIHQLRKQKQQGPPNIEGWEVQRLDWLWRDHGEDVALASLRPLVDMYEASLQKTDNPAGLLDVPILEYQLSEDFYSDPHGVAYRARYKAKQIAVFTRPSVDSKRKMENKRAAPRQPQSQPQAKRVVMKDRGGDLAGMLAEMG
ncbi:hypothetical protein N7474_004258 [Penicillium riverlandense]|uniref:uncharacterized protein n=1 Tax=Penicillium riverlandense TaxID=1903569 RepID=UPI0025485AD7|nr:uncharacterized protein N7474_004258 [Penicillium riverlandense]KAJ5818667.1 hypothetical protein N7474_004258 [Penicillium riverlandense]